MVGGKTQLQSAISLCTGNYLPKWKNKQDKAQRNWFAFSAFLCWNQICTLIVHCTKVMHRSLRNFTHPPPLLPPRLVQIPPHGSKTSFKCPTLTSNLKAKCPFPIKNVPILVLASYAEVLWARQAFIPPLRTFVGYTLFWIVVNRFTLLT